MMSKIYSTARRVIIWPGATSASLTQPIFESAALDLGGTPWYPGDKVYASVVARSFEKHRADYFACIHLPYWNRLWIFQETLLARSRYIIVGGMLINMIRFVNLMLEADLLMVEEGGSKGPWSYLLTDEEERSKALRTQNSNTPCIHLMELLNTFLQTYNDTTYGQRKGSIEEIGLTTIMLACKTRECSEIRDRWYGCMSLVKGAQGFPVDYTVGPAELTLNILEYLGHRSALSADDFVSLGVLADSLEVTMLSFCRSCALDQIQVDRDKIPPSLLKSHYSFELQPFLVVTAVEKTEVRSWSGNPPIPSLLRRMTDSFRANSPSKIGGDGKWNFCFKCKRRYTLYFGHNLGSTVRVAPCQLWCQRESHPAAHSLDFF